MINETVSGISFPEQLKTRTAAAHQRLEELPVSKSILSESVTPQSYAHYLKLMRDVVCETEYRIFPLVKAVITDLDQRTKRKSIEDDIRHAGSDPGPAVKVFQRDDLSQAFALGILYVIEGSTLGGRFIFKNIEKSLGYTADAGASYFAGYGNTTGSMWKNFMAQLTDFETKTGLGDEIIAGAIFGFESIENHFLKE